MFSNLINAETRKKEKEKAAREANYVKTAEAARKMANDQIMEGLLGDGEKKRLDAGKKKREKAKKKAERDDPMNVNSDSDEYVEVRGPPTSAILQCSRPVWACPGLLPTHPPTNPPTCRATTRHKRRRED